MRILVARRWAVMFIADVSVPTRGGRGSEGRAPGVVPRSQLAEREDIRLDSGVEERDLQRPFADRAVLAHELVQAVVIETP